MQSVQYSYEDFAKMPSSLFLLMGYDMLETPRKRLQSIMMQLYRAVCLGSHIVCLGFMFYRLLEVKTINSISLVMRYATLVTYVVNSDTKYGTVLQRGAIQSLNNKLAALYPQTTLDRIYYRVNDHFWSRTLLYIIIFYIGSSIMVVVGPIITSILFYIFHEQFLYMHCYPYFIFDPEKHSVWIYLGIYTLEWLHSTQMVISNIATDMWLIYFQVQICMHFRAMIKSIEDYQPSWEHDVADRQFLSKIVDKHVYLVT